MQRPDQPAGPLRSVQPAADLFFFVLPALLTGALALLVLILVLLLLLALALRITLLLLLALLTRLVLVLLVLLILLVLLRVLVGTHLCISGVRQRNDAGDCTVGVRGLATRAKLGMARRRRPHVTKQFMTSPGTDIAMTQAAGNYARLFGVAAAPRGICGPAFVISNARFHGLSQPCAQARVTIHTIVSANSRCACAAVMSPFTAAYDNPSAAPSIPHNPTDGSD